MQDNRWIINRAGLINFWYYDEESFDFSQGRLLLRGSNGSGKSVTMQSFIPLLLDGNKSPERLDPFGSRSRKIEDYILGEDEKDESIGYLFMEFKKKHSQNIATIGMGFKAKRGKPLKSWGFSITDGRSVGKDFFLYKQMGEKIPLTMKELENRIGDGGQLVVGQKNYMKLVNDLIFGFDDLDEYDELVKLLVQLRSPKLSKGFKPTVIYEIMENSLQALSEDDLRPMSEAIENMDDIKSRLMVLKECKGASDRIRQAFDRYNKFILCDKAALFQDHHRQLEKEKSLKDKKTKEIDQTLIEIGDLEEKINDLEILLQTQLAKKLELESHDSLKIREKIVQKEKDFAELTKQSRDKETQHQTKRHQEHDLDDQIRDCRQEIEAGERDILKRLSEMDVLAQTLAFDEQAFMSADVKKDIRAAFDFSYVFSSLKKHRQILNQAIKSLEEEKLISAAYEKLLMELDELKKEWAQKEGQLKAANRQLIDIQDESLESLYQKNQTNQEYIMSSEALNKLSRQIRQFGPSSNFFDISQILSAEQKRLEDIKRTALYKQEAQWSKIDHLKKEKEAELNDWKKIKDPQPFRAEAIKKNRQKLVDLGIPHIPLYQALDYIKGVDQASQAAIEEAMTEMGLLDALIIPKAFRKKLGPDLMADKYLFPSPQFMAHTINQYLKVDESLDDIWAMEAEELLKSILIDGSHHTHIDEKGNYRLGILRGRASQLESPKFIGSSARKKYRQEKQKKLEDELALITNDLSAVEKVLSKIKAEIESLNQEFLDVLPEEDLITAANMVKQADFNYQMSSQAVAKKTNEEKTLYQSLNKIKEVVYRLTRRISLPLNLDSYREAEIAGGAYLEELHSLDKEKIHLKHVLSDLRLAESRYQEVLEEIDDLLYEISGIRRKTTALDLTLKNLNDQLKLTDYQAIKIELEQCLITLRDGPGEKEQALKCLERQRSKVEYWTEDLKNLEATLLNLEKVYQILKDAFVEELKLAYVLKFEQGDLVQMASELLEENPIKQDKEEITKRLFDHLNTNSQYLRDYSVNSQYIFEAKSHDTEEEEKADQTRKRLNITAKVAGKVVDFYDLSDYLKDSLVETEKLLKESDRELFEDILVKNISKKISGRIFHSEKWVENMNRLMGKMDTSMGLSFSLRWTSKKAETDEQLDTRKLVNLLKTDGNLLRDEDLKGLSEHFRSKIALARRRLEEEDVNLTFHTIMKEVLDYRKWFEFKLFFKKTGQVSKELTNNAFFKFSGGEKAMAMYVPLFSAVNARYQAARKDSARILSLDEAFAGVDEQNIRDMFRLLGDLDLSYIINSQILWGDYDTVDSLAIAELIRLDNADFVTVLRYYWNGRIRKLVVEDAS